MQRRLALYVDFQLNKVFERQKEIIIREIKSLDEDTVLSLGEHAFAINLIEKYKYELPEFQFEEVRLDRQKRNIQSNGFGKYEEKEIFIYNLPYSGPLHLLNYRPTKYNLTIGYELIYSEKPDLIFIEVINNENDIQKIQDDFDNQVGLITTNYKYLKNDFTNFNDSLNDFILEHFRIRKNSVLASRHIEASLGIPLVRKGGTNTFTIPAPKLRTKIIIQNPSKNTPFQPEPTLDLVNYNLILRIINDVGKNFERMPSTYKEKQEEDLRDHILFVLDPNFELGSASGETFNKTGRTDIQLRYQSNVVFIAECKFWHGPKQFLETIDQLLGYLTWRDSKTAIVIFVTNVSITDVIISHEQTIGSHSNYVSNMSKQDINWFNYVFSLPGDRNKEISLAIMFFHLPR